MKNADWLDVVASPELDLQQLDLKSAASNLRNESCESASATPSTHSGE
jgi:hypothetical protein